MIEQLFFVLIILIIAIFLYKSQKEIQGLKAQIQEITSKKHSLSVRYGRLTEQFMPFLEQYPYNEHNFRFIGNPIDGIQFEDDKIIFVEFKTADSKLTKKQKRIQELVKKGEVEFREFSIR
jgi:predicted Holliday junction resolvase-like endonuclease